MPAPPQSPDPKRPLPDEIRDPTLAGVSAEPDPVTERELRRAKRLEEQFHKTRLRSARQNINERKKYARYVFRLACVWTTVVAFLLVAQGFRWAGFSLSDGVLIAAITSTTATVIGILVVVVKYLFPARADDHHDTHTA